jgi:hypothetical protein
MTDVDSWLERYEKSHQNLKNPVVFWAAVPMVVLGTVGVLWYLPIPEEFFEISPLLNWGSAISLSLAIGMLPFLLGLAAFQLWLAQSSWPQLGVAMGLLVSGTAGLWLGRRGPGSFRAVLQDFQLMMIGPAWLLSVIYKRFGVPF